MTNQLAKLLQLASPSLPIGGYSYSQGLEYAIDSGWVDSSDSAQEWLTTTLKEGLANTELAILNRLIIAFNAKNYPQVDYWNGFYLATRESKERFTEDQWLSDAMVRVLKTLDIPLDWRSSISGNISYVTLFACAASAWSIATQEALTAFIWQFIDNQCLVAMKLIPLGQSQGVKMAFELGNEIPEIIKRAIAVEDDDIGNSMPGAVMASMLHETQYSRLYRS